MNPNPNPNAVTVYNNAYPGSGCYGCGAVYMPNAQAFAEKITADASAAQSAKQEQANMLLYGAGAIGVGVAAYFIIRSMRK